MKREKTLSESKLLDYYLQLVSDKLKKMGALAHTARLSMETGLDPGVIEFRRCFPECYNDDILSLIYKNIPSYRMSSIHSYVIKEIIIAMDAKDKFISLKTIKDELERLGFLNLIYDSEINAETASYRCTPNYKEKQRKRAIPLVFNTFDDMLKNEEYVYVSTLSKKSGVPRTYILENSEYEYIRNYIENQEDLNAKKLDKIKVAYKEMLDCGKFLTICELAKKANVDDRFVREYASDIVKTIREEQQDEKSEIWKALSAKIDRNLAEEKRMFFVKLESDREKFNEEESKISFAMNETIKRKGFVTVQDVLSACDITECCLKHHQTLYNKIKEHEATRRQDRENELWDIFTTLALKNENLNIDIICETLSISQSGLMRYENLYNDIVEFLDSKKSSEIMRDQKFQNDALSSYGEDEQKFKKVLFDFYERGIELSVEKIAKTCGVTKERVLFHKDFCSLLEQYIDAQWTSKWGAKLYEC